jgi:hypothetical protein
MVPLRLLEQGVGHTYWTKANDYINTRTMHTVIGKPNQNNTG